MRPLADEEHQPRAEEAEKLKVFISYSRHDLAFAREIVDGLQMFGGFEVSIDTQAIQEGEDWKARLGPPPCTLADEQQWGGGLDHGGDARKTLRAMSYRRARQEACALANKICLLAKTQRRAK